MGSKVEIYEDVLAEYSDVIDRIDDNAGRKCCCCKGCVGCCHQIIITTNFEKYILKSAISQLHNEDKKNIWNRVRLQLQQLEDACINPKTVNEKITIEQQREVQEKYFNLNLPCIFLKDNVCMIYSKRPIACMTYRNYGNQEDCLKTPFVKTSITFNDVEWDFRDELLKRADVILGGFNILQYAVYDIMKPKKHWYEIISLPFRKPGIYG